MNLNNLNKYGMVMIVMGLTLIAIARILDFLIAQGVIK